MNMTDKISYDGDERCPVCGNRVTSDEHTEIEVWHDGTIGLVFHCPKCGSDWDNVYSYGHSLIFRDGRFAKDNDMEYVLNLINVPTEALLDEILRRKEKDISGADVLLDLLVDREILAFADKDDYGLYRKL